MKLSQIASLCLFVGAAHASAIPAPAVALPVMQWPVSSVTPDGNDFSDLKPFADAIGNARIVALGEQTHGAREEFLLKTRLLRFLHERMGFDVLLLESGFYDMGEIAARVKKGEQLENIAPGNVFFMYANSAEGRGMLAYVDRQRALGTPLQLGGIDSQHTGKLSGANLLPGLQSYLHKAHPKLASGPGWTTYRKLAQPLFDMQRAAPPLAAQNAFREHSAALQKELCHAGGNAIKGAAWWCLAVRSVQAQANSYWSEERDYQRDNQMGANAIWMADKMFAGKKVVIWAHTIHVARGFKRTPNNLQAGEVMHRHWGDAYKVVQFSAGGGEILEYVKNQPLAVPVPTPDSLEARLAAQATQVTGLSASAPIDGAQFSYEYSTAGGGKLGQNWDVLFFIPKVTPVRMTR